MRFLKRQNTNSAALNGRGIRYEANEVSEINSSNALIVPKGSNADRPGTSPITPVTGMIRYNTDEEYFEVYALDATYFTPGWQRFRTETPKLVRHQNLGVGDDTEALFGPLDSGDPQMKEPYAARPEQILVFYEGYYQSPNTDYSLVQNPCRVSSNRVGFYADGAAVAAAATGFATIRSWDLSYVNFKQLGFYNGQTIVISGSASNNGTYEILGVDPVGNYITLTTALVNEFNAGFTTIMVVDGFKNSTVATGTASATAAGSNLISIDSPYSGDYDVGEEIIFDAAIGNIVANKRYIIDSIASPDITVRSLEKGIATATFPARTLSSAVTFNVTTSSGNGVTAVLGFAPQSVAPFIVGQDITVSGVTPVGYNGTFTVTACTTSTVSYANATTGALTVSGTVSSTPTGSGSSVTITFAAQSMAPYYVGQTITASGFTPAGYNGTYVVTGAAVNSVSYANATVGNVTVAGTISSANNEIIVTSSTGLAAGMEIEFAGAYAYNVGEVTEVNTTGNLITVDDTAGLQVGMQIVFNGNQLGNLVPETEYYVLTIPSSTTITISATLGGPVFNPGIALGDMYFTASGATMGSIAVDTTYYVLSTPTATSVVISATSGGSQFAITRDTGYVVWESTQVSPITMINASGSVNWVSGSLYSNTTGNNTYIKFTLTSGVGTTGDVPALNRPVTAIHNFDK